MEKAFEIVVKLIHNLPEEGPINLDINEKLIFYSLYKVATEGYNLPEKPSIWKVEETLKWNSWNYIRFMNPEEAKEQYIKEVGKVLRKIYYDGNAENYLDATDMSFLYKLNSEEINILFAQVLKDKDITPEERQTMEQLYKRFIN